MSSIEPPKIFSPSGSASQVYVAPNARQATPSSNPSTAGGPVRRSKRIKNQPVDEQRYTRVLAKVTDDFHLYWLAHNGPDKTPLKTVDESIKEIGRTLMSSVAYKSLEDACQAAKRVQIGRLNSRATVIGDKPDIDEVDDVHFAPVPDSNLDIRIWGNSPGLDHEHLYCLDFVVRATRQPVNAPLDYELWVVPPLSAPWLPTASGRLTSMENSFGKASKDIQPGQEKFCLMEAYPRLFAINFDVNHWLLYRLREGRVYGRSTVKNLDQPDMVVVNLPEQFRDWMFRVATLLLLMSILFDVKPILATLDGYVATMTRHMTTILRLCPFFLFIITQGGRDPWILDKLYIYGADAQSQADIRLSSQERFVGMIIMLKVYVTRPLVYKARARTAKETSVHLNEKIEAKEECLHVDHLLQIQLPLADQPGNRSVERSAIHLAALLDTPDEMKQKQAAEPPTVTESSGPLPAKPGETSFREYYHKVVKKRYPNVQVKDDLHLYWLALGHLEKKPFKTVEETTEESARDWFRSSKAYRNLEEARQAVIDFRISKLNSPATVIGTKPDIDEIDDVHYAPVPDSDLDIRVWGNSPGLDRQHLYCLDFVDRATHEPVNAPLDFEIWVVPSLLASWLPSGCGRLMSMENSFGKLSRNIRPGQEKFCVMEGSTFQLKRAGQPEVFYNVPVRPKSSLPDWAENRTILSFTPATRQT
ncbi:hypothetical protein EWM64_g8531 [Hericium alpestre]|uniref:Uncharacterized protein n=1 Tax=Hericium alpestre TaxID=135208 RepID=A0A4Y9ZL35_9AGAM|nr:hypothetical protein EWM64_g8531 [Hericium alpestre]